MFDFLIVGFMFDFFYLIYGYVDCVVEVWWLFDVLLVNDMLCVLKIGLLNFVDDCFVLVGE